MATPKSIWSMQRSRFSLCMMIWKILRRISLGSFGNKWNSVIAFENVRSSALSLAYRFVLIILAFCNANVSTFLAHSTRNDLGNYVLVRIWLQWCFWRTYRVCKQQASPPRCVMAAACEDGSSVMPTIVNKEVFYCLWYTYLDVLMECFDLVDRRSQVVMKDREGWCARKYLKHLSEPIPRREGTTTITLSLCLQLCFGIIRFENTLRSSVPCVCNFLPLLVLTKAGILSLMVTCSYKVDWRDTPTSYFSNFGKELFKKHY